MDFVTKDPHVGEVLISRKAIAQRVEELGKEITQDYEGRWPLLVCVLKGAYAFTTDLAREIDLPLDLDFIAVSSYGSSTRTSGVVRLVKDLDSDISGREVILIEDIVDSGLTLRYLRRNLEGRNPKSLQVCSLLARDAGSENDADHVKYVGFRIQDDDYVVGYGLDAGELYRNMPYLARYNRDVQ